MSFSTEIIKILDDLSKRLGITIDWTNKNIMPYLNDLVARFIKLEIATSILEIVIGITMSVFGIYMIKRIWKNRDNHAYFGDMDESITWAFIGVIACAIIGILLILCNCYHITETILLPEIVIYNHVQNFL